MRMIDTALESLDVLFFDDKILGFTGVHCGRSNTGAAI